ncbi:TonB-dependent receptor [Gaoshiqia sediminis]|uniref:TonB-dependent receptor n=1 Tax=Gaoshiqia sediminis TaxID=2986998 RepID=A0AA42CAY4_9BACT|nr:TonB-dependent receptor [Gaoshiqia sediminis]MCW0484472.1 TonB-dependent receptor [Gaoshiqia sediminis]
MEKKLILAGRRKSPAIKQWMLVMKITVFLIVFCVASAMAGNGHSQEAKLTVQLRNATLGEILNNIEDNTNYYFMYNNELIDLSKKVDIDVQNKSLEEVLTMLFEETGIKYKIYNRQVVLSPTTGKDTDFSSLQQVQNVSGKVTDSSGEPLPGVTVVLKGTTQGTITDLNGNYSLPNIPGDGVLVFSFVGMKMTEVPVAGQSSIDVTMQEEAIGLEEVVAVGYGVQKKKLVTGATTQVKGEELAKMNTTSPLQALQGKTPGVNISSTSGQPGAAMKVTVRGLGTIGNSQPLYIIDGVEGDITTLNLSDIESIDVLKDAASAAIYGSQAANGVILVTTKQGGKGKGQVSFDAYYGVQNVERKVPLLNAQEYKMIMDEQQINSGLDPFDWATKGDLADTDWMGQMIKDNAKTQNYSLNINGGSDVSTYAMSLSYTSQEGVVGGSAVSNYERYGFRLNTEHKVYKDVLTVGEHLNLNFIDNIGISDGNIWGNSLRGAFNVSPLAPVYSDNNIYDSPYNDTSNSLWSKTEGNPYASMMTNYSLNRNQKLLGDIYAELQPVKNLRIKSIFGVNYKSGNYRSFKPLYQFSIYSYNNDHETVSQNMNSGLTLTWTNTVGYDFKINDDHAFNALVGTEAVKYDGVSMSGSNWNLVPQLDDFEHAYLDNATGKAYLDTDGTTVVETRSVGGSPDVEYRRLSYFGRLGYNYKEKYILNATLRADGSSKFATGNHWGYFPSVSAGWTVSDESFMASTSSWLNQLKLRASWGQVGNQNIPDFRYASLISTSTAVSGSNPAAFYVFGNAGVNTAGAYQGKLSNQKLKWETSEQTDFGFDSRLLKGRLAVSGDFYIKSTKDWLVQAPVPATAGAEAPWINGGSVKNKGVELSVNWTDHIGEFRYNLGVNGAYNKNIVGVIPTSDGMIHGQTNMLYANSEEFYRAEEGHAIGYFWGYQTDGLFQNEEDIAAWRAAGKGILQSEVMAGDVKFVDQNMDGVINTEDKVDLGNGMPKVTGGFNMGFQYKNFDFSMNATFAMGNKIVQSYGQTGQQSNYTTAILQRWTGEGTSNRIPRVTVNNINWVFSDLYVHDGDYLRISNINLGYDFSKLINLRMVSQCRLYCSVQNAFTFTKYNGMDPEIGYGVESWVSGVDLGYYPRPRTVMVGVNLKF